MLLVLVGAVAVALVRGGKLSSFTELRVIGWWLLLPGFGLQLAANFVSDERSGLAVGMVLASFVLLLVVVYLNRAGAGMWIAGVGILMNFTVISINGAMPVLAEAIEIAGGSTTVAFDAKHEFLDEATRLPFLADVIPIPGSVISLGDVFLAVGIAVFVENGLRRAPPLFRHGAHAVPGSAAEVQRER